MPRMLKPPEREEVFSMVAITIEDLFFFSSYTKIPFWITMAGEARNSEMSFWVDEIRCEYSTEMRTLRLFIQNKEEIKIDFGGVEPWEWTENIYKWDFDHGASLLTVSVRITDYKKLTPWFT